MPLPLRYAAILLIRHYAIAIIAAITYSAADDATLLPLRWFSLHGIPYILHYATLFAAILRHAASAPLRRYAIRSYAVLRLMLSAPLIRPSPHYGRHYAYIHAAAFLSLLPLRHTLYAYASAIISAFDATYTYMLAGWWYWHDTYNIHGRHYATLLRLRHYWCRRCYAVGHYWWLPRYAAINACYRHFAMPLTCYSCRYAIHLLITPLRHCHADAAMPLQLRHADTHYAIAFATCHIADWYFLFSRRCFIDGHCRQAAWLPLLFIVFLIRELLLHIYTSRVDIDDIAYILILLPPLILALLIHMLLTLLIPSFRCVTLRAIRCLRYAADTPYRRADTIITLTLLCFWCYAMPRYGSGHFHY